MSQTLRKDDDIIKDLIDSAKYIFNNPIPPQNISQDMNNRIVINRAYYAAYWSTRKLIDAKHKSKVTQYKGSKKTSSGHVMYAEILKQVDKRTGLLLDGMRKSRNISDYDPIVQTKFTANSFIYKSERVIQKVSSL